MRSVALLARICRCTPARSLLCARYHACCPQCTTCTAEALLASYEGVMIDECMCFQSRAPTVQTLDDAMHGSVLVDVKIVSVIGQALCNATYVMHGCVSERNKKCFPHQARKAIMCTGGIRRVMMHGCERQPPTISSPPKAASSRRGRTRADTTERPAPTSPVPQVVLSPTTSLLSTSFA